MPNGMDLISQNINGVGNSIKDRWKEVLGIGISVPLSNAFISHSKIANELLKK